MARRTGRQLSVNVLGLYLHIPFCSAICNYCNFNRGVVGAAQARRYVRALCDEIARASARGTGADTIYFGGGTPSLLEPGEIAEILAHCRRAFDVAANAEVTLEANPDSVTLETLAGYRAAGVNRISLGVQSFRDDELLRLSRLHTRQRAVSAYREAREAGFDNVSLDLMMWLPGQSVEAWLESVAEAAALGPDHLSLYMLEVYPNAPLKEMMLRGAWSQAPDEDAVVMYVTAMERLEGCGYEQYEISNLARPFRRARHNLKYWTDGDWIGLGCGAHSTLDGVRWRNVAATEEYIGRIEQGMPTAVDVRRLSPVERLEEALFTGLRLADGVDVEQMGARHGIDVLAQWGPALTPFFEARLLVARGPRLRLTRQGMLLANEIMAVFV